MNRSDQNRKPSLSTPQQILGLLLWVVVCFACAGIGSAATVSQLEGWYASLSKPSWNPPNWIFGPVWTTLFAMMAIAAWLVWRSAGFSRGRLSLSWFGIQLMLNVGWSVLFFGLQRPGFAVIEIVLLWLAIAITISLFRRHSKLAAALMVPYLGWVSFASVLNLVIWWLNR